MSTLAPVTRRVARIVFSTIKKIGNSKGVTLKKIHDYIKDQYPDSPNDIVRLNNTLEKALAFGALAKKDNRYVLGSVVKHIADGKGRVKPYILRSKIRASRGRRRSGRRRRRRSRRSRSMSLAVTSRNISRKRRTKSMRSTTRHSQFDEN